MKTEKIDLRERLQELINSNLDQLETDIQELEPKDRVKVLLDIAKFVLPTLKSVESAKDNNVFISFLEESARIPDIAKRKVP